jgi:hypothetical protein
MKPVFMQRLGTVGLVLLVWLCALSQSSAQIVTNGSFETPSLPPDSFSYDPSGATWVFSAHAGIINAPGDGFAGPPAPDGSQYAFLQSVNASGSFLQTINFSLSGTFLLSYLVAARPDNGQGAAGNLNYEIRLDSTVIATDATVTAQPFSARLFQFTADVGSHTLTFEVSPGATGDNTAFFDSITIQVPEPATALLLVTFAPVLISRAIKRRNQ